MRFDPHAQLRSQMGPTLMPTWANYRRAALFWFDFGLAVIPIRPGTKATSVRWDPWLADLSRLSINYHWQSYPADELGFIVGDSVVVFDADNAEALAALEAAEVRSGVTPLMVVRTKRGQHHYFRRDAGLLAMPSARDFPACLDVKIKRTMVVLPGSADKTIIKMEVSRASDLSVASQAFIDALTAGSRRMPAPSASRPPPQAPEVTEPTWRLLHTCLRHLNPDLGYLNWFAVAAALFHTTGGSDDAYLLFDSWSADGRKYKGTHETRKLWNSLRLDHPRPRSLGTLISMLKAAGVSWDQICDESVEPFDAVDGEGKR